MIGIGSGNECNLGFVCIESYSLFAGEPHAAFRRIKFQNSLTNSDINVTIIMDSYAVCKSIQIYVQ